MPPSRIEISSGKCVGCGLCVKACPFGAISMADEKAVIDRTVCNLCGNCISSCKFEAILIEETPEERDERREKGQVWVYCEKSERENRLTGVSRELLGHARNLADALDVESGAVLLGSGLSEYAPEMIAFGADHVYLVDHPALRNYDDQRYAGILAGLITGYRPEILLGGATATGRALLPRVAVQIHTGLTADCTELSIDPETSLLRQTRPAFGGNILATITCRKHRPQMATVRPGVLPRPKRQPHRKGRIIERSPRESELASNVEWLKFIPRKNRGTDLREAEIIVTAGYGTGGEEGVKLVAQLARALGGALGASRPVVDSGWLPYPHQVGQTGTTVQPKLYIACGVSGAIQHLVGMQNSEIIVAVNRDPEAAILQHADYAIVDDLFEVIPEIIARITDEAKTR